MNLCDRWVVIDRNHDLRAASSAIDTTEMCAIRLDMNCRSLRVHEIRGSRSATKERT